MNLLFFGDTGRQLFGAYHPPRTDSVARGAALLCAPWGSEYIVSHRVLRRLASRLSDSGYHVLRFDYHGTGDSAGSAEDGDLTSWLDDAALAVDELRDMSGCQTVSAFGIRLGAVICWRLAVSRDDVTSIVMWDPVVDGVEYVNEMVATQSEIDRWSLSPLPIRKDVGVLEVLGNPLTPAMRRTIEAVNASEFERPIPARVIVVDSDAIPAKESLHRALRTAGTSFHVEVMPGQTPWREDLMVGQNTIPHLVLERVEELQQ